MSTRYMIAAATRRIAHRVDVAIWTSTFPLSLFHARSSAPPNVKSASYEQSQLYGHHVNATQVRLMTYSATLDNAREDNPPNPSFDSTLDNTLQEDSHEATAAIKVTPVVKAKNKGSSRTPPRNRQLTPLPALNEADIEEDFMRGRGPGGQAIQKTSSLVALLHVPTGVRVKCQETRSREKNRQIARRLLSEKVDAELNGAESRLGQKWDRARKKKEAKRRKGARKRKSGDGGGEEQVGERDEPVAERPE